MKGLRKRLLCWLLSAGILLSCMPAGQARELPDIRGEDGNPAAESFSGGQPELIQTGSRIKVILDQAFGQDESPEDIKRWEEALNRARGTSSDGTDVGSVIEQIIEESPEPEEKPKTPSSTSPPAVYSIFEDVSSEQYFFDAVLWAVALGITNGTSPTTFSPGNTCTRAQIITFLWRAYGSPTYSGGNPFPDVNPDSDFGKAAQWAYRRGLVLTDYFEGGTKCTRAEAVTYLWKLFGAPVMRPSEFSDVSKTADYSQAVAWAVEKGITNGTSATTFSPANTCTRGQIVTFIFRAFVSLLAEETSNTVGKGTMQTSAAM